MVLKDLEKKIKVKKAKVGVIGLGYVGLPLAAAFAKAGFSVTGIDTDANKVAKLRRSVSYVLDVPSARLKEMLRRGLFRATGEFSAIADLDAVIICVPTPLLKDRKPDVSFMVGAAKMIARHLKKGQLVVLESTTYPGTTEEVLRPILEKRGLKVERDFFLAFSPERVDPGNKAFDTVSIPKVVGGIGPRSSAAARTLYGAVMRRVVGVSSARTAEMVKLLENTFRSANIALINEMSVIARHLGVDIWEVIEAAKTKPFGFMPFYPGPGTGGHCLPVDPLYLSWKSRLHGFKARMIELSSRINKLMPGYVVRRIQGLLGGSLKRQSVLVLGVAYKKNIDDVRESPALDVISHLIKKGAVVSYSDPFVPSLKIDGRTLRSQALTTSLVRKSRCTVILTDHSGLDYSIVAGNAKRVLDTRNVLRKYEAKGNISFL